MEAGFQTTHWSLVQAAADSASPASQAALEALCRTYWPTVYAYLRRRGHDVEAAQDLTQGFFTELIDKKRLKGADRERGRFRSFLLVSVKNFAANEWDRSRAKKRGGGNLPIPLDLRDAEPAYRLEPREERTPETIFERRWAIALLKKVHVRLEQEMEQGVNRQRFTRLKLYLTGDVEGIPYREVAAELQMSESAVKVAVFRLRRRFGRLLREEIAHTLADPAMIDEEINFLLKAIVA